VSCDDLGVLIGYAYASSEDREGLTMQLDVLRASGCERVFADAGSWRERPELERALSELCDGSDCLVVCRLDRLGRSLRDLIATAAHLEEREIGLCSLEDGIETAGADGQPMPGVFGALARFDRVLARERTRAGVVTERARERRGGRQRGLRPVARPSGLEFAPDLIEPIIGFRHWRLVDGALTSMFSMTPWPASEMTARCPAGHHDPVKTPSPGCTCGIYTYYEPCPRTASASTRDLIGGAVVVWGRVEAHATGVRAEHARIVGLDLPLTRGRKRGAVLQIAERLGVPAIAHRKLKAVALAHGSPLPASLRPPRTRSRATAIHPWNSLAEHDS
jgi:DNA invertase Pin-like site-specific DNA recombinase